MTVALSASTVNPRINVLPLSGRLAVETEVQVKAQLMEALQQSPTGLVLDLEAVRAISP